MAIVSVPLGLAIGALVPRELDGTLVLIVVVGVGMSVPPDTAVARALPTWGPLEVLQVSAGWSAEPTWVGIVHALGAAMVLLIVAALAWRRRLPAVTEDGVVP
jgi:hypothetical protein